MSEKAGKTCAGNLRTKIEAIYADRALERSAFVQETLCELRQALNQGEIRAAYWDGEWATTVWVKKGLILLTRFGKVASSEQGDAFDFDTLPCRRLGAEDGVRIIHSSYFLRDGAHVSRGCTLLPQSMIQAGAFIGESTMVGQGVGIGVCAQIGARVQLNGGVQVQGNLEPLEMLPTIIGDDVSIGANSVIGAGVVVGNGAFIFPGTSLTRQVRVYDPIKKFCYKASDLAPLVIPSYAVVMPGTYSLARGETKDVLLGIQVAIIAGYSNEPDLPASLVDRLLGV